MPLELVLRLLFTNYSTHLCTSNLMRGGKILRCRMWMIEGMVLKLLTYHWPSTMSLRIFQLRCGKLFRGKSLPSEIAALEEIWNVLSVRKKWRHWRGNEMVHLGYH